jgi:hypothetical protein
LITARERYARPGEAEDRYQATGFCEQRYAYIAAPASLLALSALALSVARSIAALIAALDLDNLLGRANGHDESVALRDGFSFTNAARARSSVNLLGMLPTHTHHTYTTTP